jgi:hypothetical protein
MTVEAQNDLMERIVRLQGGGFYLVEWDNAAGSPGRVGELCITALHPKQLVPQAGGCPGLRALDPLCVTLPQPKEKIRKKYGVDVRDEPEENPEVRGADSAIVSDLVTQNIMFHRNEKGGIGLYSWVNGRSSATSKITRRGACPAAENAGSSGRTLRGAGAADDRLQAPEAGRKGRKASAPTAGAVL